MAYNDANEQTGMTLNGGTAETRTYDGWGRLASRAQGSYAASYGYRYGGRLHTFTSNFPGEAGATLQCRGDGRMYQRTVGADTFTYRYDAGWNPVNMEYANGTLATTSVYAPGTAVGERLAYAYGDLATGTVMYACHDQLGSVRRWRTPSKGTWGANEFEPYGEAYAVSTLAPRDYALHEWDPALAVYRAPYRNYSPTMTRWTSRDPLGMVDGPNMYGYVKGRTISDYDPNGTISICGIMMAIIWMSRLASAPANDKYKHCLTTCEIVKSCGRHDADMAGEYGELLDEIQRRLGLQRNGAEDADRAANAAGLSCGDDSENCGANHDCGSCCEKNGFSAVSPGA